MPKRRYSDQQRIERFLKHGDNIVYSCVVKQRNELGEYVIVEELETYDKREANAAFVGTVIAKMDNNVTLVVELQKDRMVMKQFWLNKNL